MARANGNNCEFQEAVALFAVGINGDSTILEIEDGNSFFLRDAANLACAAVVGPDMIPETPGLYEFRGFSVVEEHYIRGKKHSRIVHKGRVTPVAVRPLNPLATTEGQA